MKSDKSKLYSLLIGAGLLLLVSSCIDKMKFGNAFLDKPQGGMLNQDSIFSNAEYTRQFLVHIYSLQYYGLPYSSDGVVSSSPYTGKFDALTDCWQLHWNSTNVYNQYYQGNLNAASAQTLFAYTGENVWQAVRAAVMLIDKIGNVPGLEETEKKCMVAEAKCLIAARYFDMFHFYGGLPLVDKTMESLDPADYALQYPRATVENTVKFMVNLLDEAINTPELPFDYEGNDATEQTGRWTQAGAMALKCQILQFAASPLFNSSEPYNKMTSATPEQQLDWWYGGYKPELWQDLKKACEAFFQANAEHGNYFKLNEVTKSNPKPEDYRQAYRMGYIALESREILHSVRVHGIDIGTGSGDYSWHAWSEIGRNSYTPTQEYVNMFSWADGTPFDYDKLAAKGTAALDTMFLKGTFKQGQQSLSNIVLTRDPRLYESVRVNGMPKTLGWSNGTMSGDPYELWIGGSDAKTAPQDQTGNYATGYDNMKYYLGSEYTRQYTQWVYIRLSDLYLTYAEALLQADNNYDEAIRWVDKVRARVGLKGLVASNSNVNMHEHDNLLNAILHERACELGMENSRYFDIVRYKLGELLTKPLHGLQINRKDKPGTAWRLGDKSSGTKQPTEFTYQVVPLKNTRAWWNQPFDSKWYLSPFPVVEVNKGYGLIQNPGW